MADATAHVLELFSAISRIPRCSKKEDQISQWIRQWGQNKGFATESDQAGNVVIRVPASTGHEATASIILQSHMDMVCEKNADSNHHFDQDPIELQHSGDWLHARGTTLGADNGIGMALAMALAEDAAVKHPPLELLFTVDEETGLTGAKALAEDFLQGRIMVNIDSEDEGIFTVGCAGGRDTHIQLPVSFDMPWHPGAIFKLSAHGMRGGHSGVDIHRPRANAIQILARALHRMSDLTELRLIAIRGGKAHNAIPREAHAVFACQPANVNQLGPALAAFEKLLREEYGQAEPSLALALTPEQADTTGWALLTRSTSQKIIGMLLALPHGAAQMSTAIQGLVETSSNLAKVEIDAHELEVLTSQRSSLLSRLDQITARIGAVAHLAGARTRNANEYPPWQPTMDSPLLKHCQGLYRQLFQKEPVVEVIHAGLECAVIGARFADMDMISLGPTIENPHSPDERLLIPSIAKVWDFLAALLASYQPPR